MVFFSSKGPWPASGHQIPVEARGRGPPRPATRRRPSDAHTDRQSWWLRRARGSLAQTSGRRCEGAGSLRRCVEGRGSAGCHDQAASRWRGRNDGPRGFRSCMCGPTARGEEPLIGVPVSDPTRGVAVRLAAHRERDEPRAVRRRAARTGPLRGGLVDPQPEPTRRGQDVADLEGGHLREPHATRAQGEDRNRATDRARARHPAVGDAAGPSATTWAGRSSAARASLSAAA